MIQQTIVEGINDLIIGNKNEQQTKSIQPTISKKSSTTPTISSKQKGSKQISIRGIPLVNFLD